VAKVESSYSEKSFGGSITEPIRAHYPEFKGKVAVITGAGRGIGARFAEGLAERGAIVYAADLDTELVDASVSAIKSRDARDGLDARQRMRSAAVDVTVASQVDAVAARVANEQGRLDYWVNNAGIFPTSPVLELTTANLEKTMAVNVNGTLSGAKAAAQIMAPRGGGAIVNMGSVAANRVRISHADYCAAKAAVEHLTRCLAVELGPLNIRVNGIGPGDIDTSMIQDLHDDPSALDTVLKAIPLRRIGTTHEVLATLLFLLSDGARYITGHVISVDGGSRLVH
jgi:3-oxoacyl-[acyl-carrier protein] reductase